MDGWFSVVPDRGMLIRQREKLGLTQEEVAERAGITLKQYQMYESHDGRNFSSTSMRIVNAVLTVLELDPTAYANGEYALRPIEADDPLNKILSQI
jgi:transcriptional regulator with XRE-family HTH domain